MKRFFLVALAACAASAASAQSCPQIRFAPGAYSGEISGHVTQEDVDCYTFGTGSGQTARLQLFGSDNTCFAIIGVVDCQEDFSFVTRAGTYQVNVSALFRTLGEDYTLRLTIR